MAKPAAAPPAVRRIARSPRQAKVYLIYEVRLRITYRGLTALLVYIGRTASTLERRKAQHLSDVARGSQRPFHHALRLWSGHSSCRTSWRVVYKTHSHHESMLEETRRITAAARMPHVRLLNLTRGGYYDKVDFENLRKGG